MIDYRQLGVRTLINASGTVTTLGGSLMPAPVLEAMQAAAGAYVDLPDLLVKSGEYLARRIGVPAAFVSCGAASGMQLAAAACLTGSDVERVRALPNTSGWANEFVIGSVDPHDYIHQGIEACGGRLVRVGTSAAASTGELVGAIGTRTAAVVFFLGSQSREQLAEVARGAGKCGVPVIVDAAAQLPPRSNLTELIGLGASLAVFSGGKGIGGPQSTGLVVGTPELVAAVRMNSSPESGIGRGMKVGKEEIMGLLAAVDLFLGSSDAADLARWEAQVAHVARTLVAGSTSPPATVSVQRWGQDAHPDFAPRVHVELDPGRASAVITELWNGEPRIAIRRTGSGVLVDPMTLQRGQERIVATRLRAALDGSPTPASEWGGVNRVLGGDLLARLLVISPSSVRRYLSGSRVTPDEVAARLHFLALIIGDLAGAYNEFGIRRWFQRPRKVLGSLSPAQILSGTWQPEDSGPRRVRELVAALVYAPAT